MPELKPCPFCGNNYLNIQSGQIYDNYWVYCGQCGVKTRKTDTKEETIEVWNRRANNAKTD